MIATTTISSIRVNPRICVFIVVAPSVFSLSARVRASSRGGGAARGRPEFGAVGVAFTAILDGERTRADGRKSTGHVDLRRHAAGDTHATQRTHVPVRIRDRAAVAEITTRFRAGAREQVDGIQETAPRGACAIDAGGRDPGGQAKRSHEYG